MKPISAEELSHIVLQLHYASQPGWDPARSRWILRRFMLRHFPEAEFQIPEHDKGFDDEIIP